MDGVQVTWGEGTSTEGLLPADVPVGTSMSDVPVGTSMGLVLE